MKSSFNKGLNPRILDKSPSLTLGKACLCKGLHLERIRQYQLWSLNYS